MKIVISNNDNVRKMKNIFQHLHSFNDFIRINISHERFYIQGMDKAHILLFELNLKNTWFDEFNINSDEDHGLIINSKMLYKVLNVLEDKQDIIFMYDNGDNLTIKLKYKNSKLCKTFLIPLNNEEIALLEIPSVDYQCEFKIDTKTLSDIISNLEIFNDIMEIKCSEDLIVLSSNGIEGCMNVEISIDEIIEYAIEEEETITLKFSLLYFTKMCMFNKLNNAVSVNISGNYPLELKYNMDTIDNSNDPDDSDSDDSDDSDDSENSKGLDNKLKNYFRFCLAPKIDE